MNKLREEKSDALILRIALRHLGNERELIILKVKDDNYYAFPPYAKKPEGHVDCHRSWHASGQFRTDFKIDGKQAWSDLRYNCPPPKSWSIPWKENRIRPTELTGVGKLFHSFVPMFQFPELPSVGTHEEELVPLVAPEQFIDDAIFVNVYLVAPDQENKIPIFPGIRGRILHLEKRRTPWLAVEIFQPTEFVNWDSELLREWELQSRLCECGRAAT